MENTTLMNKDSIVEVISLRDQTADIIRRMIINNEFEHNQQITERMVSSKLSISTTPVKEAFRILETEGLIYTIPRKGTFVSEFSKTNMQQIAFIRSGLEGVAAYYAATYITDEEILKLREIMKKVDDILESGNGIEKIGKLNYEFHMILRCASRNTYLVNLINTMRSIDNTFREVSLNTEYDEPIRAHKEHRAILDAIELRNPVKAEEKIVTHIRRVALFVLEKYE